MSASEVIKILDNHILRTDCPTSLYAVKKHIKQMEKLDEQRRDLIVDLRTEIDQLSSLLDEQEFQLQHAQVKAYEDVQDKMQTLKGLAGKMAMGEWSSILDTMLQQHIDELKDVSQ